MRRLGRAAAALAVVLGTSGCAGLASGPPDGTASVAHSTSPAAVGALLDAREAALLAGDAEAFAATVSEPDSPAGARQLAAFRSARDLRLGALGHDPVPAVADPAGGVVVRLRYRVDGIDRADRTTAVRYRLALDGTGWRVAAEEPVHGEPAAPWLAMPGMRVERGEHAVVAGVADGPTLAETVATVDAVLPGLAERWEGTPRHVLVLLPRTPGQADTLLGRVGRPVGEVAATTEGPLGVDARATGDRVVLDPTVGTRLGATGREVVLAHELAHVAVRSTVPGSAPGWLTEGYADHVGYRRAGLPVEELAARLLAAVRAGTAPTALPSAADLDPATRDIAVGYLAAWQAAETVVERHGEGALEALLRACATTDEAGADRRCDAAMPDVLGESRADLTRAWRQRLAALSR